MTARFAPLVDAEGTRFRLYAPSVAAAEVVVEGRRPVPMAPTTDGFLEASVPQVGEGARYRFRIGDLVFPDLASRQQHDDAAGWSVVRRPMAPSPRTGPIRDWPETIICEVHVGAVTPEGTFQALEERLGHFRDAGYTCLELMPVNEFPGRRNWGYDGTLIFAPESSYGSPEDLRRLIDSAHALGLCMILDVVYNHFGKVDNFASRYVPEWFDEDVKTPWGPAVNVDNPMVRQFYYENARMWLTEYDFDGLRFDAVHEIKTESRDRFLGELAQAARAAKPSATLIIENTRNSFRWLERDDENHPMTYIAQWNDDIHHVLDYLVTGDGRMTGYGDPEKDPHADLEKALADGFVHDPGEGEESDGTTRGGPASKLPPDSFVGYVQNHDQIGNRADAKRLPDRATPEKLDFALFVKFLAPQIPLCFMGDEGGLRSGFPFFIDFDASAARSARDERYRQMRETFHQDVADGALPEPNDPETFLSAKLRWDEYDTIPDRREALERFRGLCRWRREIVWPLTATPCLHASTARSGNAIAVNWRFEAGTLSMALNAADAPGEIACLVTAEPVAVGQFRQDGEQLRLDPWSAVVWGTEPLR